VDATTTVIAMHDARQLTIGGAWRSAHLIRNGLAVGVALTVCAAVSARAADCDVAQGEQVFEKCSACHSLLVGQHMMGPSLNGLNGRKAGTVDGFNFSTALRDSDITWNDVTLNAFLKNPQSFIPGTVMPFGGIQNAPERTALVCYLVSR
jgi:cytochrome c2